MRNLIFILVMLSFLIPSNVFANLRISGVSNNSANSATATINITEKPIWWASKDYKYRIIPSKLSSQYAGYKFSSYKVISKSSNFLLKKAHLTKNYVNFKFKLKKGITDKSDGKCVISFKLVKPVKPKPVNVSNNNSNNSSSSNGGTYHNSATPSTTPSTTPSVTNSSNSSNTSNTSNTSNSSSTSNNGAYHNSATPPTTNSSNSSNTSNSSSTKREWTVIGYWAADNNLDSACEKDIQELKDANSNSSKAAFVLQIDRETKKTGRYVLNNKKLELIEEMDEINTGDPKVLYDFIKWSMEKYPAKRYALELWGHGTGWISLEGPGTIGQRSRRSQYSFLTNEATGEIYNKDIIYEMLKSDPTTGLKGSSSEATRAFGYDDSHHDCITLKEFKEEVLMKLNTKFDLIAFDCCLMNNIEVGYQLKNYTNNLVAAVTTFPGMGFYYTGIANALYEHSDINASQFATAIYESNKAFYNELKKYVKDHEEEIQAQYHISADEFISNNFKLNFGYLKLDKIDNVITNINKFSSALLSNFNKEKINSARENANKYGDMFGENYGNQYTDLYEFANYMENNSQNDSIKTVCSDLKSAIDEYEKIFYYSLENLKQGHISIYFPKIQGVYKLLDKYYKELDFYNDCKWNNFLTGFFNGVTPSTNNVNDNTTNNSSSNTNNDNIVNNTSSTDNNNSYSNTDTTNNNSNNSSSEDNLDIEREWTVIGYWAADNNLDGACEKDIKELTDANSDSSKVAFVLQIDRETKDTGRYVLNNKKLELIEKMPEINTGDPKVLYDFIKWAIKKYPAKKYALELWGHGSGWISLEGPGTIGQRSRTLKFNNYGIVESVSYNEVYNMLSNDPTLGIASSSNSSTKAFGYDDSHHDCITLKEFKEEVLMKLNTKFDLIAFDCCLMNNIEVGYQLKNYTNNLVAAVTTFPGMGFYYTGIANSLYNEPTLNAEGFAKAIYNSNKDFYTQMRKYIKENESQIQTQYHMSADEFLSKYYKLNFGYLKLDLIDNVISKLNDIIEQNLPIMNKDVVKAARDHANGYGDMFGEKYGNQYTDLFEFVKFIETKTKNSKLKKQCNELMSEIDKYESIFYFSQSSLKDGHISIYFPEIDGVYNLLDKYYKELDFYNNCKWNDLLKKYFN